MPLIETCTAETTETTALCPSIGPTNTIVKAGRWYYEATFANDPPEDKGAAATVGWGLLNYFGNAFAFEGVGFDTVSWGLTVSKDGDYWSHHTEKHAPRKIHPVLERFDHWCEGDVIEARLKTAGDAERWSACVIVTVGERKLQVRRAQVDSDRTEGAESAGDGDDSVFPVAAQDVRRHFAVGDAVSVRVPSRSEEAGEDAQRSIDGQWKLLTERAEVLPAPKEWLDDGYDGNDDALDGGRFLVQESAATDDVGGGGGFYSRSQPKKNAAVTEKRKWTVSRAQLRHRFVRLDLVELKADESVCDSDDDDADADADAGNDDNGNTAMRELKKRKTPNKSKEKWAAGSGDGAKWPGSGGAVGGAFRGAASGAASGLASAAERAAADSARSARLYGKNLTCQKKGETGEGEGEHLPGIVISRNFMTGNFHFKVSSSGTVAHTDLTSNNEE